MSGIGHKIQVNYKRRGGGPQPQPLKSEGEGKRHLAKALKKPLKRRKK